MLPDLEKNHKSSGLANEFETKKDHREIHKVLKIFVFFLVNLSLFLVAWIQKLAIFINPKTV